VNAQEKRVISGSPFGDQTVPSFWKTAALVWIQWPSQSMQIGYGARPPSQPWKRFQLRLDFFATIKVKHLIQIRAG
jgi:hypothetical protein